MKYYVKAYVTQGIDYHDTFTTVNQLSNSDTDGYEIEPEQLGDVIMKKVDETFFIPKETRAILQGQVDICAGSNFQIPLTSGKEYPLYANKKAAEEDVLDFCDMGNERLYSDTISFKCDENMALSFSASYAMGQVSATLDIYIYAIPEGEERYLVIENFLHPAKGFPNTERMYHEPFAELSDAIGYKKELESEYGRLSDEQKRERRSEIILLISSESSINPHWLKAQRDEMARMESLNLTIFSNEIPKILNISDNATEPF